MANDLWPDGLPKIPCCVCGKEDAPISMSHDDFDPRNVNYQLSVCDNDRCQRVVANNFHEYLKANRVY